MNIVKITGYPLSADLGAVYGGGNFAFSTARLILVKVETDEGITGLATLHGHAMKEVCAMLPQLLPLIAGTDALAHEAVWQKLFDVSLDSPSSTHFEPRRTVFTNDRFPLLMRCLAGIDIALWDIKGKALGLPVWRLLGGSRNRVPAYVTGGYYRSDQDCMQFHGELASYVDEGFSTVKIKIGALPVNEDLRRVAAARKEIGDDCKLILDVNNAYSWQQAADALARFEAYDIHWVEEAVHWYDSVQGLGKLSALTRIPLSSGESEFHAWACRDLIDHAGIRIMQYDATRGAGVTDWLRVAAYAGLNGVTMSTHHQPHIQCHLSAAVQNGGIAETFSRAARDPFWEELYTHRAQLVDGEIVLGDEPGFGFDVDWKVVEKYRI
ncbi:mandelate racemase/muconate lactonizing enzyme family protein [Paraburkholderia tropica]|uniref:mandelate racemase/muconate lactonizing enzyme family protein n=1 Tax=Paraburkholderia tropica TaxID=92647 RepID=UPI0030172DFB